MTEPTPVEERVSNLEIRDYCVDEIRRRVRTSGHSLTDLSDKSGLTKSAVSLILNGKRSPNDDSLTSLAQAVGLDFTALWDRTEQGWRHARVVNRGTPFLGVGPFVDSLFFAWAATTFITALPGLTEAAQQGAIAVRPWSRLLTEVAGDYGPLFCLANEALAARQDEAGALGLVKLNRWRIRLRPCYCLIGPALQHPHEPATYSDIRRAEPEMAPDEVLQQVLERLGGKLIVVESGSDIEANTRLLLTLIPKLRLVERSEWRSFFDHPSIAPNEVVLVSDPLLTTSSAMTNLAIGCSRDNVLLAAGAPQSVAASRCQRGPRLEVLLRDVDLREALPNHPIRSRWMAPNNKIFASRRRLEGLGIQLAEAAEILEEIFRLLTSSAASTEDVASWIQSNYEPYGGSGVSLDLNQYVDLIEKVTFVERLRDLEPGFVPAGAGVKA